MLISVSNISSPTVMTLELDWKPRWVIIISENSLAMSTLDIFLYFEMLIIIFNKPFITFPIKTIIITLYDYILQESPILFSITFPNQLINYLTFHLNNQLDHYLYFLIPAFSQGHHFLN